MYIMVSTLYSKYKSTVNKKKKEKLYSFEKTGKN